jgi:hypothetical protein
MHSGVPFVIDLLPRNVSFASPNRGHLTQPVVGRVKSRSPVRGGRAGTDQIASSGATIRADTAIPDAVPVGFVLLHFHWSMITFQAQALTPAA